MSTDACAEDVSGVDSGAYNLILCIATIDQYDSCLMGCTLSLRNCFALPGFPVPVLGCTGSLAVLLRFAFVYLTGVHLGVLVGEPKAQRPSATHKLSVTKGEFVAYLWLLHGKMLQRCSSILNTAQCPLRLLL